jgi:tight adherence protein C
MTHLEPLWGLGAGLGIGLWALAIWLVPPRPALNAVLRRGTEPPAPPSSVDTRVRWSTRLTLPATAFLHRLGLPRPATARNLAVLDRDRDDFLTETALWTLGGILAPTVAFTGLAAIGAGIDLRIPLALTLAGGVTGFLLPDLRARQHASRRRAEFRHALSSFLDLVVISLAGGAGVDSALNGAVTIGHGWAFHRLQRALATARLTRDTPWSHLRDLGRELDITELTELAASISLAGTEGAKVRNSLATKAAALRAHQLTDAEGQANTATERLCLPMMALFLGFLTFIAYPAVTQILNGL